MRVRFFDVTVTFLSRQNFEGRKNWSTFFEVLMNALIGRRAGELVGRGFVPRECQVFVKAMFLWFKSLVRKKAHDICHVSQQASPRGGCPAAPVWEPYLTKDLVEATVPPGIGSQMSLRNHTVRSTPERRCQWGPGLQSFVISSSQPKRVSGLWNDAVFEATLWHVLWWLMADLGVRLENSSLED